MPPQDSKPNNEASPTSPAHPVVPSNIYPNPVEHREGMASGASTNHTPKSQSSSSGRLALIVAIIGVLTYPVLTGYVASGSNIWMYVITLFIGLVGAGLSLKAMQGDSTNKVAFVGLILSIMVCTSSFTTPVTQKIIDHRIKTEFNNATNQ